MDTDLRMIRNNVKNKPDFHQCILIGISENNNSLKFCRNKLLRFGSASVLK